MLKDITLGQYYPADSAVHKLDPRVKLVATVVFIISLFVFRSISSYLTATLFLAGVIRLSKVPFRYMVKGLKTIFILMLITVAFNLFLTDGMPVLQIWKLTITLEGIRTAAFMAIRLIRNDPDHHPQRSDGRDGEGTAFSEENSCAGP